MIKFILNDKEVTTDQPPGMILLDFIRYHKHLKGTKTGCNEGDCGACTVLVGEIKNDTLEYNSFTSCLTPLANAQGKHIVTVEGLNMNKLNVVQQAMHDESATQCGFCTPGFVVSLAGFCLSDQEPTVKNTIASVDGNICRCTGYKSIERAAGRISEALQNRKNEDPIKFAVDQQLLPNYFSTIKTRLKTLSLQLNGGSLSQDNVRFVGGGTDLYVQKHDEMHETPVQFLFDAPALNGIHQEGNRCILGPSVTVTDLIESPIIQQYFPNFKKHSKLVSSTPIRNMATIGGNFINASPIGDFTIFFLALDAQLTLSDGKKKRDVPLRKLYKGYKTLDKISEEFIEKIAFELPDKNVKFNFEKVSKRTHLDIASVNSAIKLKTEGSIITEACLSAGGAGPTPKFLEKTSSFLTDKEVNEDLVFNAIEVAQSEISPISDARGSEEYKRLLLSQLIKVHFITLFPELNVEKVLV